MLKKYLFILVLMMHANFVNACLSTYQLKLFPVGVSGDKIISVDVQVNRMTEYEGRSLLKLDLKQADEVKVMWIMYSCVATYNRSQQLISQVAYDTTYSISESYTDTLEVIYKRDFDLIVETFPDIEFFKPVYISFCDFQQRCQVVSVTADTIKNKDYLVYKGKRYLAGIFKDTSYYGLVNSGYFTGLITDYFTSSVRILKSSKISILIAHLASGHEISMGWITSDPKKVGKTEYGDIVLAKEHKPSFAFNDIRKAFYKEPLLHHGFGFDVFIIE